MDIGTMKTGLLRFLKERNNNYNQLQARTRLSCRRQVVGNYIEHYNTVRLHSAIGYVAPADKLNGLEQVIFKERDRKLEAARELRKQKRQQGHPGFNTAGEDHLP